MKHVVAIVALLLFGCCNFRWPNIKAKARMEGEFQMHPKERTTETVKVTTDE